MENRLVLAKGEGEGAGWTGSLGFLFFVCFVLSFVILGMHLQHMEVPRLGV